METLKQLLDKVDALIRERTKGERGFTITDLSIIMRARFGRRGYSANNIGDLIRGTAKSESAERRKDIKDTLEGILQNPDSVFYGPDSVVSPFENSGGPPEYSHDDMSMLVVEIQRLKKDVEIIENIAERIRRSNFPAGRRNRPSFDDLKQAVSEKLGKGHKGEA